MATYLESPEWMSISSSSSTSSLSSTAEPIISNFTSQIAAGLHHIHSLGIIHLDVKPDNILISREPLAVESGVGDGNEVEFILKLADFGMAVWLPVVSIFFCE